MKRPKAGAQVLLPLKTQNTEKPTYVQLPSMKNASKGRRRSTAVVTRSTPTSAGATPAPTEHAKLEIDVQPSDASGPSSTASNKILKDISDTSCKPSPSTSNQGDEPIVERKKRKYEKKKPEDMVPSRKSNRINQNVSPEIVNNYTERKDYKQPRGNMIPVGLNRVDYEFPSMAREYDKLKIDMIAQNAVTVVNTRTEEPPKTSTKKASTTPTEIKHTREGSIFQANLPDFKETVDDDFLNEPDREELIWTMPQDGDYDKKQFDELYSAVRLQHAYRLELDKTLSCFMNNDYNVDKTLCNIESELTKCVQPFKELNIAQRQEWERLRYSCKSSKQFRVHQERFLRKHYLGEIISYYYRSKPFCCPTNYGVAGHCARSMHAPKKIVKRVECFVCAGPYRDNAEKDGKLCAICELYFRRNKKHRNNPGYLRDDEIEFLKFWAELETTKQRAFTCETIEKLWEERRQEQMASRQLTTDEQACIPGKKSREKKKLCELSKTFKPATGHKCSFIEPWAEKAHELTYKTYTAEEKFKFVHAFEKIGFDFPKVAAELYVTDQEVAMFYQRFKGIYDIDQLIKKSAAAQVKENKKPPRNKKRAASEDSAPPKRSK